MESPESRVLLEFLVLADASLASVRQPLHLAQDARRDRPAHLGNKGHLEKLEPRVHLVDLAPRVHLESKDPRVSPECPVRKDLSDNQERPDNLRPTKPWYPENKDRQESKDRLVQLDRPELPEHLEKLDHLGLRAPLARRAHLVLKAQLGLLGCLDLPVALASRESVQSTAPSTEACSSKMALDARDANRKEMMTIVLLIGLILGRIS